MFTSFSCRYLICVLCSIDVNPDFFFFFFLIISFFIFGCTGSLLLCRISLVAASRGYSYYDVKASHCGGFSCYTDCQSACFSTCGSWALERGLSGCGAQA